MHACQGLYMTHFPLVTMTPTYHAGLQPGLLEKQH